MNWTVLQSDHGAAVDGDDRQGNAACRRSLLGWAALGALTAGMIFGPVLAKQRS
jgi:hypothetical protein